MISVRNNQRGPTRPWGQFLRRGLAGLMVMALVLLGAAPPLLALTEATAAPGSIQPYLDRAIANVTEFRLNNGMKFIVMERHEAPVVSFITYADVGGVDEPEGQTGVAHFLEHLAFKGSSNLGTKDIEAERRIYAQMDALGETMQAARDRGDRAEADRIKQELIALEAQAQPYIRQNEFGQIVERQGGVGLNAATSADATMYFYSFPSNKVELWMSLESERFLDPVFREFYKEQDVILEERRMRTDNSPIGTMVEAFLDAAYEVHPYRRPVIGYNDDIRNLTRENVRDFFDSHYGPENLTVAIAGDVDPKEVKRLAEIYFGRFVPRPQPPSAIVPEPPQTAQREVTVRLDSQPWYLEGYHAPAKADPDYGVYEAIASILSGGRTSRLYKRLVEEEQIALTASSFYGFPGDRFPTMMLFYALTAPGHSVEEIAASLHEELERLKTEPVDAAELERVKTQARAGKLQLLDSNAGLADLLAEYEVKTGDWRNLFKSLDRIAAITPADIQRVARKTLRPENRTVGRLLPKDA
jgi:predicted Zn-dependent peptidase